MIDKILRSKNISTLPGVGPNEIRIECPKCRAEGNRYDDFKLGFNTEKKIGHCFRCGWFGGLKALLKLLRLADLKLPTPSLKDLKNELSRASSRTDQPTESVLPRQVVPGWLHKKSRRYLQQRGYNRATVERYGILYCTGGYFKNRLILPIFDDSGRYRTYSARYIGNGKRTHRSLLRQHFSRAPEKYLYPKGFHVSRLLGHLNTYQAKKRRRFVIVGEGYFDGVYCAPYGVCSFGTNFSDAQVNLLRKHKIKRVCFIWDHDKKRIARYNVKRALAKAITKCRPYFVTGAVWLPRRGSDIDEYPKKLILKWVEEALSSETIYYPKLKRVKRHDKVKEKVYM